MVPYPYISIDISKFLPKVAKCLGH